MQSCLDKYEVPKSQILDHDIDTKLALRISPSKIKRSDETLSSFLTTLCSNRVAYWKMEKDMTTLGNSLTIVEQKPYEMGLSSEIRYTNGKMVMYLKKYKHTESLVPGQTPQLSICYHIKCDVHTGEFVPI